MGNLNRQSASLPEGTMTRVQSSQFTAKILANMPVGGAAALQSVSGVNEPALHVGASAPTPGPISLGDALMKARSIAAAKMPFEMRAEAADAIVASLALHASQVTTEIYGQCILELARGFQRRELPMNRRQHVSQIIIARLDPRATQMLPVYSRRVVRVLSCTVNQNTIPTEASNAAVAIILRQMVENHWSNKERAVCLELLLHGMNYYGYSELVRGAVINRVLRHATDQTRPLTPEEYVRLAGALAGCLWKFRVPTNLVRDSLQMSLTALRSKRGSVEERGLLALGLSFYMNDDFSFTAPIEDLREVAQLAGINADISAGILFNIKRQPESYYRSLSR